MLRTGRYQGVAIDDAGDREQSIFSDPDGDSKGIRIFIKGQGFNLTRPG